MTFLVMSVLSNSSCVVLCMVTCVVCPLCLQQLLCSVNF